MILNRRAFLTGLIAAPAVIAADRLMKLPRIIVPPKRLYFVEGDSIMTVLSGTNDLYMDGMHPKPLQAQMDAYLSKYINAGFKVKSMSMYPAPSKNVNYRQDLEAVLKRRA